MSNTIQISEAIQNGIDHLREERIFGKGSETFLASRNLIIALFNGNERAAIYWRELAATCRKLEQCTPRT